MADEEPTPQEETPAPEGGEMVPPIIDYPTEAVEPIREPEPTQGERGGDGG